MYGLKYVKGMVLSTQKDNDIFLLTLRNQTPTSNYIQCLSMMRIGYKSPEDNSPDLFYNTKNDSIVFYNEFDKAFYSVNCSSFQFIDIERSKLQSEFFMDSELLNNIIGVFITRYYDLNDIGESICRKAKNLIDSGVDLHVENVENNYLVYNSDYDEDYEDDEFVCRIREDYIKEEPKLSYEKMLYELSNKISELDYSIELIDLFDNEYYANMFVHILNTQPVEENRNVLYKQLGINRSECDKIRKHIKEKFPELIISPRKK